MALEFLAHYSRLILKTFIGAILLVLTLASVVMADELRNSLDASLSEGDNAKLMGIMNAQTDPASQLEIRDWIKEKVDSGEGPASFALTTAVADAKAKKIDDALEYLNYYRAILLVDSSICPDPSSGGAQIEATLFVFARFFNELGGTDDQKRAAISRAMKLESEIAPKRLVDPSLCNYRTDKSARDLSGNNPAPQPLGLPRGRYAANANWKDKRAAVLPNLEKFLAAWSGLKK